MHLESHRYVVTKLITEPTCWRDAKNLARTHMHTHWILCLRAQSYIQCDMVYITVVCSILLLCHVGVFVRFSTQPLQFQSTRNIEHNRPGRLSTIWHGRACVCLQTHPQILRFCECVNSYSESSTSCVCGSIKQKIKKDFGAIYWLNNSVYVCLAVLHCTDQTSEFATDQLWSIGWLTDRWELKPKKALLWACACVRMYTITVSWMQCV